MVLAIAAAYPVVVLALAAQHVLLPQQSGPFALLQIVAPHLAAGAILLIPVALIRAAPDTTRTLRILRSGLAAAIVVGAVRFGPGLVSLPAAPPAESQTFTLMSWNLAAHGTGVSGLRELLLASDADVVGIQELRRSVSAELTTDPAIVERFPYMILRPSDDATGIGLLSRLPLSEPGQRDDPSAAWATVDIGAGVSLFVVTAHPAPASIDFLGSGPIPIGVDAAQRDAALVKLRRDVVDRLAAGRPLVLFGDLNVTDREPGFAHLTAGLQDAHAEVGLGPGSTWRPPRLEWLPFGLLRIDHVLTGGGATPVAIETDCTPRGSDHCVVYVEVAVPSSR